MELVEGDPRIGQIVGHSFDEGRRHIDADRFDIFGVGLVGARIVSKADNGLGVAPFGDEYDLAGVGVGRQSQIVMTALVGSSNATASTEDRSTRSSVSST